MFKVHSKYWWNNKIEACDEYKLEFRTKENLFDEIENEIKKIHDYKVAEISYYEINNASQDFLEWIDKETKYKKFYKLFDFFTYFEYNNYRKMRYHRNVAYRLINILN